MENRRSRVLQVRQRRAWLWTPVTEQLTFLFFLHLRTTNLPGPDSITSSEQAQQRRLERKYNRQERRKRRRG